MLIIVLGWAPRQLVFRDFDLRPHVASSDRRLGLVEFLQTSRVTQLPCLHFAGPSRPGSAYMLITHAVSSSWRNQALPACN